MIAVSETGVSTKTEVRDGSVLKNQHQLQWVNKLLPILKAGNPRRRFGMSITLQQRKCSRLQPTLSGQTRHSGAIIDRVCGFRTLQELQRLGQWRSFSSVHWIRHKQSSGGRLPLSPARTPKQPGNTRAVCRGIVDKATAWRLANPMTGEYVINLFGGSGSLTKATIWICDGTCFPDSSR